MAAVVGLPGRVRQRRRPSPVLTLHNNNGRAGAYLSEKTLNTANVNAGQFGKLFVRAVDGQIYAQPLYVPRLAMPGGVTTWSLWPPCTAARTLLTPATRPRRCG